MKISFSDKKLSIEDKVVIFDFPIVEIIETKEGVVVRIKSFNEVSFNNIYFVNYEGMLKWRIHIPGSKPDDKYYYTGMELEGDDLGVGEWGGYSGKVNLKNGEVFDWEFTK